MRKLQRLGYAYPARVITMDAIAGVYTLILCSSITTTPCYSQKGAYTSLTRQECIERMWLVRWSQPKQRAICISRDENIVDVGGWLTPEWDVAPKD